MPNDTFAIREQIAVLGEQMRQVNSNIESARKESREQREELRDEVKSLKTELVTRMDAHERSDASAFKNIDDRMAGVDRTDAAEAAVARYKRWVVGLTITLISMAGAVFAFLYANLPHFVAR